MDEVQKNISKITDQLETLKVNNDQLNSRLSKIERSTTARDFYVSTLEKEIRRVFERQGRALKRLFTEVRCLTTVCTKVSFHYLRLPSYLIFISRYAQVALR